MKLSEAIRLGAMMHPQCFENHSEFDSHANVIATCALGAADQAGYVLSGVRRACPQGCFVCPACGNETIYLDYAIAHLNDYHNWTRERIADWVETLEAHAPEPSSAEPASIHAVVPVLARSVSGPRAKDLLS